MSIFVEKDESGKEGMVVPESKQGVPVTEGMVERPTGEGKSTEAPKGRMYYVYDICRWPW